jgi:deoxycytidylate deaminase
MKVRFHNVIDFSEKIIQLSTHNQHKMCAIITDKKDNLLSIGINQMKTHTQQFYSSYYSNHKKIFIHAEIHAIHNLERSDNIKAFNIYILRLKRSGVYGIAMPCETCYSTINVLTPIKHIIYTNKNGNLEYLI